MTSIRSKKILIIDDDPELGLVYKALLEREGYREIRLAKTGDKGLVVAQNWRPDLIISDILHPGLDGFSVFEELFLNPTTLSTRFIIVSGCSVPENPDYAERAEATGVSVCLNKPVLLEELLKVVYKVLAEAEEETRRGL